MTLAHFVINSLDLLGQLDVVEKQKTIDWIYSLQIVPKEGETHVGNFGFRGSPFYGYAFDPKCTPGPVAAHDQGHIAMDYCALCLLLVLGDDFSRIDKKAVLGHMRSLQQPDGSFSPVAGGSESDMRFVYAAAAVCYMLDDWSGMNVDQATDFIRRSQRYDGGFGQGHEKESHGGSTYCAVAALYLMNRLDRIDKEHLIDWLSRRQSTGFQGRINKVPDSCYGFWIGASLKLLGVFEEVVEKDTVSSFVRSCGGEMGGFAKHPDANADVLHTFYSLCALNLCGAEADIQAVSAHLGVSERAAKRLEEIRKKN